MIIDLAELRRQIKEARRNFWHAMFTFDFSEASFFHRQIKKLKFDIKFYERLVNGSKPFEDYYP